MIEKAVEWLLKDEEARRIFQALKEAEGGVSPSELFRFLPKPEAWQLKCILGRMVDYGVVMREPNGKFSLTENGRKLVELEKSLGEVKKIG
jgi:predicted transcriptional regulator